MAGPLTIEQIAAEWWRCSNGYEGFIYWCRNYVYVEDKETHKAIKFDLWPCQEKVARDLVMGKWLWILKARRLGLTWLLVAFCLWLVTFFSNRQCVVLNQDKEYAKDFLDRVRFIQDELPEWMQVARVNSNGKSSDNKTKIEFNRNGHGCVIRSVACTLRAIRSLAADVVIFDEAAYQKYLKNARLAAQPAVETGNGQIIGITTSDGPRGDFYETWGQATSGKNRYVPVFLHWKEHPKRDDTWYAKEAAENENDPLYMKREYPATPEEAFESAEGRVYPLFASYGEPGKKFLVNLDTQPSWKKHRAIDWGGVDPFVCLWGCVVPGDGASLTVDPACANLTRELLAYSRDDNGDPADEHNHACDALRYMVTSNDIRGHLHIYREMYIVNSAAKGFTVADLGNRIIEESTGETFTKTIADRSRPDSILLMNQIGLRTEGHLPLKALGGRRAGEIEQGIFRVNALVVATAKGDTASGLPERKVVASDFTKGRGFF